MASYKIEICLKKKKAWAQLFRYFCYESRNNNQFHWFAEISLKAIKLA